MLRDANVLLLMFILLVAAVLVFGAPLPQEPVAICATNHKNPDQRCACVEMSGGKGCKDGKRIEDPRDEGGHAVCSRHCSINLCHCCAS